MRRALDGKIAVVTGGSTGIGLAIAQRFTAEGARVFITGRRQLKLDEAVAKIGPGAIAVRADSADLDGLYDRVGADARRIDVLVANAGGGSFAPLESVTEEQSPDAIRAGDAWYQAFPQDIIDNDAYPRLAMPVLALGGPGYGWLGSAMPAKAADLELVRIADSGHFIAEEIPDVLVRHL